MKYALECHLQPVTLNPILPTFKPDSNWTFKPICSILIMWQMLPCSLVYGYQPMRIM